MVQLVGRSPGHPKVQGSIPVLANSPYEKHRFAKRPCAVNYHGAGMIPQRKNNLIFPVRTETNRLLFALLISTQINVFLLFLKMLPKPKSISILVCRCSFAEGATTSKHWFTSLRRTILLQAICWKYTWTIWLLKFLLQWSISFTPTSVR